MGRRGYFARRAGEAVRRRPVPHDAGPAAPRPAGARLHALSGILPRTHLVKRGSQVVAKALGADVSADISAALPLLPNLLDRVAWRAAAAVWGGSLEKRFECDEPGRPGLRACAGRSNRSRRPRARPAPARRPPARRHAPRRAAPRAAAPTVQSHRRDRRRARRPALGRARARPRELDAPALARRRGGRSNRRRRSRRPCQFESYLCRALGVDHNALADSKVVNGVPLCSVEPGGAQLHGAAERQLRGESGSGAGRVGRGGGRALSGRPPEGRGGRGGARGGGRARFRRLPHAGGGKPRAPRTTAVRERPPTASVASRMMTETDPGGASSRSARAAERPAQPAPRISTRLGAWRKGGGSGERRGCGGARGRRGSMGAPRPQTPRPPWLAARRAGRAPRRTGAPRRGAPAWWPPPSRRARGLPACERRRGEALRRAARAASAAPRPAACLRGLAALGARSITVVKHPLCGLNAVQLRRRGFLTG